MPSTFPSVVRSVSDQKGPVITIPVGFLLIMLVWWSQLSTSSIVKVNRKFFLELANSKRFAGSSSPWNSTLDSITSLSVTSSFVWVQGALKLLPASRIFTTDFRLSVLSMKLNISIVTITSIQFTMSGYSACPVSPFMLPCGSVLLLARPVPFTHFYYFSVLFPF